MGFWDVLNGMRNGPRGPADPAKDNDKEKGMSPILWAILALIAYKAFNRSEPKAAPANPVPPPPVPNPTPMPAPAPGGGLSDIIKGGLGGLVAGGITGSVLSKGLGELIKQFERTGHGDTAKSWVGTGPNKAISPDDLEKTLGHDTMRSLAEQAGLSQVELAQQLSHHLPATIDELTPEGRIWDEDEFNRRI